MPSIYPSEEQFKRLMEHEPDGPVVMLNLLRFRDKAEYEEGAGEADRMGQEAYVIYSETAQKKVEGVGGSFEWVAASTGTVIGPSDEEWDVMALVRYPNRKAFLTMTSDPEYLAVSHHRTAALADSRLIALKAK